MVAVPKATARFSASLYRRTPTVLASFNGTNGESPEAGLTLVGSTLYGTAGYGGGSGDGEVFSVPLSGGTPDRAGARSTRQRRRWQWRIPT